MTSFLKTPSLTLRTHVTSTPCAGTRDSEQNLVEMILFLSLRGAAQIPGSEENLVKMILLQSPRGVLKRYSEAGKVPLKNCINSFPTSSRDLEGRRWESRKSVLPFYCIFFLKAGTFDVPP